MIYDWTGTAGWLGQSSIVDHKSKMSSGGRLQRLGADEVRGDRDNAGVLDLGVRGQLLEREDGEAREGRLEKPSQREAGLGGNDHHRGRAGSGELGHAAVQLVNQVAAEGGLEREADVGRRAVHLGTEQLLKARIERQGAEHAGAALEFRHEIKAEAAAD